MLGYITVNFVFLLPAHLSHSVSYRLSPLLWSMPDHKLQVMFSWRLGTVLLVFVILAPNVAQTKFLRMFAIAGSQKCLLNIFIVMHDEGSNRHYYTLGRNIKTMEGTFWDNA